MNDMARQRIVLQEPGMDAVSRRTATYPRPDGRALEVHVYRHPDAGEAASPAVVFVSGYPDPGFQRAVGCAFREMGAYVSWAELVAARGMTAITYENEQPVADAACLLAHLQANAAAFGIDPERLAIWSCSGNVPTALAQLADPSLRLAAAVLCYGYCLDPDGRIAGIASRFGFADATTGFTVEALARVPALLVRAGRDEMPLLNETIDHFAGSALASNYPLSLINYPEGVHAFDLNDDSEASRRIIRRICDFLACALAD